MDEPKALLSILSHVAHGYVGNRACTFPLQYYGWDVDTIHTTDFSNHPGYGKLTGTKATPHQISQLFQGLRDVVDFSSYKIFIVGYCPNADVMQTIYNEVAPALVGSTRPILVVDPVLGDNGKLYVPEAVVPVHRDFLKLGLVDLTTPNQFEIELLTNVKIDSWNLVKVALDTFYLLYRVENVVILSVEIDNSMYSVGYCHSEPENSRIFRVPIQKIGCLFNGSGDVLTGLLTNEFYANGCRLSPNVLARVLARLNKILLYSYEDEKRKTGQVPLVVKDVRLISLRKVLDEDFGDEWDATYM